MYQNTIITWYSLFLKITRRLCILPLFFFCPCLSEHLQCFHPSPPLPHQGYPETCLEIQYDSSLIEMKVSREKADPLKSLLAKHTSED